MRVLPDYLRDKLRKPLGLLVDEDELLRLLKKEICIVSIGDHVTYTILKHNVKPVFCVVDFKIKRDFCSDDVKNMIQSFGGKKIRVKNPPGCISDDLWDAIKTAYKNLKNGSIRIEVEGEEDLAALAAIYLGPRDATVIYGLPNKGVVVVKSNEENKKRVKEILDEM